MQDHMTPIAYPTIAKEEKRWGFDVWRPEGMPMAWVLDWKAAKVGWGITDERANKLVSFDVGEDLSQLTADDILRGHSYAFKLTYFMLMKFVEDRYHEEGWRAISRMWGNFVGESYWKLVRKKFGSPVPVDRIIWYQDIAHMFFGPDTHAYSWCDEAKAVCARQRCLFRPMLGMQSCAKFCRVFDDAIVEAYMEIEPDLICMRTPDLGDDGTGERCVHMWTYEKEVVEKLDDKYKVLIPDSTKKVLEKKGVCL